MSTEALKSLVKIQHDLKAPKGQLNKFGGYNYRSCEDILTALKPLLLDNQCIVTLADGIRLVSDDRYYVEATATLTSAKDGSLISVRGYAREDAAKKGMDLCQVTGAASSYARKYALNGLFAIDDTKDSDSTNTHGKRTTKTTTKIEVKKVPPVKESDFDFDSSCPNCLKYGVSKCYTHKPKEETYGEAKLNGEFDF